MSVTQLASASDVATALGRALTAAEAIKVEAILDKASELFRLRSGQQFTPGTSTVRLKVNGGEVRLPQRPVTAVTSVTYDDGGAVAYTRFGSVLTSTLRSHQFVRVTYSHGAETIPDVVRLCIADIGRKVLEIGVEARRGLTQYSKTDGPFSESGTYAAWAVGGQTMLAPDDNAIADTFRGRYGSVIVQRS